MYHCLIWVVETECDDFISVLTRPIKSKQALTYDSTSNEKEIQDKTVKCEAFLIGFITGGRQAREREYPYQVLSIHHAKLLIYPSSHSTCSFNFIFVSGCTRIWKF